MIRFAQTKVEWGGGGGEGVEGEGMDRGGGGNLLHPDQSRTLPQYFILGSRR